MTASVSGGSPPGKVLVALSGGVDSSTAALLLLADGWIVEGVTLDLVGEGGDNSAPAKAARLCALLGIPHHVVDGREFLRERVVAPFLSEYLGGRTPNPCVLCNERVKFPLLLGEMERLGFDRIATGHYAVLERGVDGSFTLAASPNSGKDQSYFLYRLGGEVLSRLLLPVGSLEKGRVRELAREARLPVADEEESQDVCFLHGRPVAEFIEEGVVPLPGGEIVDLEGNVVGKHGGIHRFTVGQRKGLGVSAHRPLYVHSLDTAGNRVVVSGREQALSGGALLESVRFPHDAAAPVTFRGTARIRYRHPGVACVAEREGDELRVRFDIPQAGVAPGQSLVLYEGNVVAGGGIIRCPCD